jgi:signal transduction histidine kinase
MITPTVMAVTSRVLRTVDELRSLLPEWTELMEQCPTATPFHRPEWLLPWIETFLPREIAAIEIRHEGVLAGFAPFLIYPREAQQVLAFSVRDTGIGIPSDKQQIIFEAFQQADGSTSRKYGGTGLGLAISKTIVENHGGKLSVVTNGGEGVTFAFSLPISGHS